MKAAELPAVFDTLPAAWRGVLPGWTLPALSDVAGRVRAVSGERDIAPDDPFRALRLVPPDAVRVVIFGQDPYPLPGDADGLAFSARGVPQSLRRVFQVLKADRPDWMPPRTGKLDAWAAQGVLLLNPILTVEVGPRKALSHAKCGWQLLTSGIVSALCDRADPPVFLLWGGNAARFFDEAGPKRVEPRVLRTRHPSYDHQRAFMADGSHFVATADRVDWWALPTGTGWHA